jgi:hypothetical protein
MPVWHGTNGLDTRYQLPRFCNILCGIIRSKIFENARISPLCSVTGYSVSDPDSIRSVDPDSGGQKLPTKKENSEESSCFEVLNVLF